MPLKTLNVKGSRSQDLAAAREELKQFRRDVAILKKKGILDKNKYDARSVTPSKYLKSLIKQFSNVIEGKATPVKVSKEKAAYYKGRGYSVRNGRVIVPTAENEKVYGTHGNFVRKITGKGGSIQILDLGLSKDNVLQWQDDLRNNRFKVKENEALRFQLNGYNSHLGFSSTRLKTAQERMADYLENYDIVKDAENGKLSGEDNREIVEGLVIFKVTRDPETGYFPKPEPHSEDYPVNIEIQERKKRRAAERAQARLGRMTEKEYNEYLDEKAETEKARRAKLTPAQKEAYRKKAKDRAAKSRANKKK
jgi:hypothetical protein